MKVATKIGAAKRAIEFISRHDDAQIDTVSSALDLLAKHIEDERTEMKVRRAKLSQKELTATEDQKEDYEEVKNENTDDAPPPKATAKGSK